MVPDAAAIPAFPAGSPFRNAVALETVGGGEETNPALVSKVDNAALADAVRRALKMSGLLGNSPDHAPWRLKVFLVELKYPGTGFTTTVDSFVRYTLIRAADKATAFDDIVTASFTATVGDVYVGIERLKVANEGAIRANIQAFLTRLSSLDVRGLPKLSARPTGPAT